MPDCKTLDRFVTPYVDGELGRRRPRCRRRASRPVSAVPLARRRRADRPRADPRAAAGAHADAAPAALRARCAAARQARLATGRWRRADSARPSWRARVTPFALAATLVLIVGGAFVYELTDRSARVMAAELTADHIKCFGVNRVLGTHDAAAVVESSIASSFGLRLGLPERPDREGLELVGERPCLYGEGRVAHIMYRHNGHPVSVFMLPKTTRPDEIVEVMGHEAAIWSAGGRTFVLIAREPRGEVERMATLRSGVSSLS